MIALFTDFGFEDPYVGQVHAALAQEAPGEPVIDLFHAVPPFEVRLGAYLLPALATEFPVGTVFACVVDPGVGGPRQTVAVKADGRWYVGPDNGLLEIVARRARDLECRVIKWLPERLSASFHGRDLFSPVAARLARGIAVESEAATLSAPPGQDWPDDLPAIVYVDHYGNAITGFRAQMAPRDRMLVAGGRSVGRARVFSDVPAGTPFWYENSNGLVEIAINRGDAGADLGLRPGDGIRFD